jgi:copper chaperone CopZ
METRTVRIPGIRCEHCLGTIRRELEEVAGVESVEGRETSKEVTVRWNPPATWEAIQRALEEMGYPPEA